MDIDELRKALDGLPADVPVCLSLSNLQAQGFEYERRPVGIAAAQPGDLAAGAPASLFMVWAGGIPDGKGNDANPAASAPVEAGTEHALAETDRRKTP